MAAAGLALILSATRWEPADADYMAGRAFDIALLDDPSALNPWSRYGSNASIWSAYVGATSLPVLYTYTAETFDWVPGIASGEPTPLTLDSDSGLWHSTVALQRDYRWSDGSPVTAHDVAFTFESIAGFGANQLGGEFPRLAPGDILESVAALDQYTVEFRLKRRDARYPFGVLLAPIMQQAFWRSHVDAALESDDPINAIYNVDVADEPVAGAFLRGTWERGSFVDRPANMAYSGAGSEQQLYENGGVAILAGDGSLWSRGVEAGAAPRVTIRSGPNIGSAHYRIYGSQAAAVLALQAGEVDFLLNSLGLEIGFVNQLRGTPGIQIVQNEQNGIRYMGFNMRREPMDDLAFRQAVATLIDRDFVTQQVLQGVAYSLSSIVPPANAFWYNEDVQVFGAGMSRGERIVAAVELMEAAGYTWETKPELGADGTLVRRGAGVRMPDGEPMRPLELLTPTDTYDAMRSTFGLWAERWINDVGIPVQRIPLAFNVLIDRVQDQQDMDMWILGYSLTPYPSHLNNFFHSDYRGPRQRNTSGYASPEYDALVDEFLQEADDLDRAAALADELQVMLARDLPWIPLFDTPIIEAYRSDSIEFATTRGMNGIQGSPVYGLIDSVQFR